MAISLDIVRGLALLAISVSFLRASVAIPDRHQRGTHHQQHLRRHDDDVEHAEENEREIKVPCSGAGCAENQLVMEELSEEELREVRIEFIKRQILEKLKLSHPPNITFDRPSSLPKPLRDIEKKVIYDDVPYQQEHGDNPADFYAKTTDIVVFGKQIDDCPSDTPAGCFKFDIDQGKQLTTGDVQSAELWFYPFAERGRRHQTLVIRRLAHPNNEGETRVRNGPNDTLVNYTTSNRHGWAKLNIKDQVHRWIRHSKTNHGIQISCPTCYQPGVPVETEDNYRPFLILHTREQQPKRTKRSAFECSGASNDCCRQSLRVEFADIGWDKWIIQPQGYMANYCKGSCVGLTLPKFKHTQVMQAIAQRDENLAGTARLTPCCAPTRLSSISLLYYDEQGIIKNTVIPDMIVEACGCS